MRLNTTLRRCIILDESNPKFVRSTYRRREMSETLDLETVFPVIPDRVYAAWLNSEQHSRFTGAAASIDARVGGEFTAWDGYIHGRTLELEPPRRIVQAWRTTDFPPESPDSLVEVTFSAVSGGTLMVLKQTGIPAGQAKKYEQGWMDYYFEPMQAYFSEDERFPY